jgi:hypothetical protein
MPRSLSVLNSSLGRVVLLLLATLLPSDRGWNCHAFSTRATPSSSSKAGVTIDTANNNNNVLILDHINMNHGKGRHDWLEAFYGATFLGCAWDPRKAQNLERGSKTLWANLGAHQFHLPEGAPDAQVLDGTITVVHPSLSTLLERASAIRDDPNNCLHESVFGVFEEADGSLTVTDPWGTVFSIASGTNGDRDPRGSQPGDPSEGCAISDLTIHVPADANLEGIGRFYQEILGAKVVPDNGKKMVQIQMGPYQTLTFLPKESVHVDTHVDLREIEGMELANDDEDSDGTSTHLGNYGVHISLYVAELAASYQKARDLNLAYVNTRFSRRAYTLEAAIDDCMFRCLDIVDPQNPDRGPILRLEHEVRSVTKKDGSKYKSCPFDAIPEVCV